MSLFGMKLNIVIYTASTLLNRGSVLVFFPILTQVFSLEDFGVWSVSVVVSNLLIPIVSANGASGILREGSEDARQGVFFLFLFFLVTFLACLILFFGANLVFVENYWWIKYAILISGAEAGLFLGLTFFRAAERPWVYFALSLLKSASLLMVVLHVSRSSSRLSDLFWLHFVVVGSLAVFGFLWVVVTYKPFVPRQVRSVVVFSLALIPHGMSQWVISSSDRVVIEHMLGAQAVGIYSLAYNLALVLMLLNSAIYLALPGLMIRSYGSWLESKKDDYYLGHYTNAAVILYGLLLGCFAIDKAYFGVLGYYKIELVYLFSIIYFSVYLMGQYYFFANYLFYHRKASVISMLTLRVAVLNCGLTVLGVFVFGLYGAAFATLISYGFYLWGVRRAALAEERSLAISVINHLRRFSLGFAVLLGGVHSVV